MSTLVLGLYAEGRTDERFLPNIIQRTAENVLARRGRTTTDVMVFSLNHSIDRRFDRRADRILEAARRTAGYHALIVHADADHPQPDRALAERFEPGRQLVAEHSRDTKDVCRDLVPLIPVQMTEAWMLADPEAFCRVVGTPLSPDSLGLPPRPHQVESEPSPKQRIQDAIEKALAHRPKRRRRLRLGELYEPLAQQIRLERLDLVPAYQDFVANLVGTLDHLGFLDQAG